MADEKSEETEAIVEALLEGETEESKDLRKEHEHDVKKASKHHELSGIEKRERDIHPSGVNGLGSGPGPDHKTGLRMVDLSVEDQAKRRNR